MIQNQTITINNKNKGTHRTFMIKTVREGNLQGKQIISLLTGQDNESDYQGFGFVTDQGVRVWRSKDTEIFRVFAAMIEQYLGIKTHGFQFAGVEFLTSRRCMVCNRVLTTPESIERGIGPECAARGN